MQFSAAQIAMLIQAKIEGDPEASVRDFGKIEEAKEGQLAFLANPKYEDYLYTSKASVIIVNESLEIREPLKATLLRVPDAYAAFATLLAYYQDLMTRQLKGKQEPSYIASSASVGENCFIGAFAFVGENTTLGENSKIFPQVYIGENVKIGNNVILYPGVKIYQGCRIGNNVTIHAGTVIGSDGFGYAPLADGSYKKVPQIGNVVVEDNVEIGSNSTIDRATIGSTTIKEGVKIDNLVHIAHNVEVGMHTAIAAQAGVSGSTKIGKHVMIGGQAGIVGHIHLADGVRINAQSGVSKAIKTPNAAVTGSPAFDYTSALKSQAVARNLPELERRIKELENMVKLLLEEKEVIK